MTTIHEKIEAAICAALPTAQVIVEDPMDDGKHLEAIVIAEEFAGVLPIKRHRMVYAALGDAFETDLHALKLITKTPQEMEQ